MNDRSIQIIVSVLRARQSHSRFSVSLVFIFSPCICQLLTSHSPVRGCVFWCACAYAQIHTLIKPVQNNNLPVMITLFYSFFFNFIFYMRNSSYSYLPISPSLVLTLQRSICIISLSRTHFAAINSHQIRQENYNHLSYYIWFFFLSLFLNFEQTDLRH